MPEHTTETIVALASGALPCAVAVVRLSGGRVPVIARALMGGLPPPRRASLRTLRDRQNQHIDQAIVIYYPAPHSYTGEAVLELQVHGSTPVVRALIDTVCASGARHARPGEFTERAFFNDRIDLVQAEAVADLIGAQTLRAARAAHNSLRGVYSRCIRSVQDELTQARVRIEANIDFPEEDLQTGEYQSCATALESILGTIATLGKQTELAIARGQSLSVALIGEPNAGKSTLLNALSGEDLVIVSDQPGTTRDAVGAEVNILGWVVRIVDTAGIRSDGGDIEREGIRRARMMADQADRIWWIRALDSEERFGSRTELRKWLGLERELPIDMIFNKIDLTAHLPRLEYGNDGGAVWLSGKTRAGLDQLGDMVRRIHESQAGADTENEYSARRRHGDALRQVSECVMRAGALSAEEGDWELIAEELRLAQTSLDLVLGKISNDDLLGEIFSSFCIGK